MSGTKTRAPRHYGDELRVTSEIVFHVGDRVKGYGRLIGTLIVVEGTLTGATRDVGEGVELAVKLDNRRTDYASVKGLRVIEHAVCPTCGALNGPSERLGSGRCNDCLAKLAR